jgi:glycosyltransferase involved in cell wall biosynthesis
MADSTPAPAPCESTAEFVAGRRYKQLLFINDYPPSALAGAPIIARQLFKEYDASRLDVIHCASWNAQPESFLPCRHIAIRAYTTALRPRRFFIPIEATLNCLRLDKIMAVGRQLIRERGVEALFSTSYGAEMPHAAYFLSREFGLPFYYFEMDRLDAVCLAPITRRLITRNRLAFLKSAKKLWLISPNMIRAYRELYGVEGELLHNFVDVAQYESIRRAASPHTKDKLRLTYAGSFNGIVNESMAWLCRNLNAGMTVGGRPAELTIYSRACPAGLAGPHVSYGGFINHAEMPQKLVEADVLVVASSFTPPPGLREQVETSMATKTVDYLAAGRPVLIIGPQFSGLVNYFGPYSCVVDALDDALLRRSLERLASDQAYVDDLRDRGLELVRTTHSLPALREKFLSNFLVPAA